MSRKAIYMSQNTPKGFRLHIGLFGRRNVGKSSLLNAITRQQVSIVSQFAGTTTDPVEKPMELLPLGPVLFIDTAGIAPNHRKTHTSKTKGRYLPIQLAKTSIFHLVISLFLKDFVIPFIQLIITQVSIPLSDLNILVSSQFLG